MDGTAAVIGGGIGGLATAIGLQTAGWRVTVYERAAALPTTGTALGIWPSALRALDALGLGDQVRSAGRAQDSGAFLRPDGSVIATIDVTTMTRRSGDPVHLLSRPPLLRALAGALQPDTIRFGSAVTDPRTLRDSDLVVAADGINSRIRGALFGRRHQPRYVGATAWRGTVDGDVSSVTETWGEGARFGITPQESGRTNWFAGALVPEGQHSPGAEVALLRGLFGHWHPAVRRVLDQLTEATVLRHDLYDLRPPLPSYVHGNVALIGDAAHAMTPDLGRGACEALIDGVTLARQLIEAPDLGTGLAGYDRERRRPTQRLAGTARLVSRMAHARTLTPLRDLAMKTALRFGAPD
jgi:2-polyprenyl-6-methoxyphenol hydroxylase-like FAD-dependent oxidoreductase